MKYCQVSDCSRLEAAKGYCHMHYNRWRRRGSPSAANRMCRRGSSVAERLEVLLDKSGGPDACWPFTGAVNRTGYAWVQIGGVRKGLHVWAYEEANGPLAKGLLVRHRCDNRLCSNPRHLEAGTLQDNMNDKVRRGRQARVRGVAQVGHKLNDDAVREIRASTLSAGALASRFSVSPSLITLVRRRERWAHVTEEAAHALA